uniref:Uncharacterized protein n=1 Tax=Anguilla anguilla TaxID=7936 RepID=A0A0E9SQ66_ANGAN
MHKSLKRILFNHRQPVRVVCHQQHLHPHVFVRTGNTLQKLQTT